MRQVAFSIELRFRHTSFLSFFFNTKIQKLINKCDLIIPLGVVIRGETAHYKLISETVTQGLMDLMIKNDKPVIMGLLASQNEEQALKRANPDQLNKGKEFAQTALEILALRNN